jgi:hypothetical protein
MAWLFVLYSAIGGCVQDAIFDANVQMALGHLRQLPLSVCELLIL